MKIPLAIKAFAGVLALLGLVIGIQCYLNPSSVVTGFQVGGSAEQMAIGMLGARNVAMALVLIVALISGKPSWLCLAFIMRLFTEIQDLLVSIFSGNTGMPPVVLMLVFLGIFIIPEILCIRTLWRLEQNIHS